jgi:adenylate cyclase
MFGADLQATAATTPPAPTGRPAIAVLPFTNLCGDPGQDYFAEAVTQNIKAALSRHRWLAVAARNTMSGYRSSGLDLRRMAAEVGVGYVVQGSVRRGGNRLCVVVELVEARRGETLWAERYDRTVQDVFDIQDEISDLVVGRREPEIGLAERSKAARAPRTGLPAWESYHLGVAHFFRFTAADNREALRLLQRSREMDPECGDAHAWWAYAAVLGMVYWDAEPDRAVLLEALAAAGVPLRACEDIDRARDGSHRPAGQGAARRSGWPRGHVSRGGPARRASRGGHVVQPGP